MLVRDEADRDLRVVIGRCLEFSDAILVLDDGSTDDTVKIATELGCLVKQRVTPGMWGAESAARQELWERGVKLAKDGWLLFCDADQILVGDPRPFTLSWESNTICFPLLDMWSETEYRIDGFWQAHNHPRPWLVKPTFVPDGWTPQWSGRGLHVGHLPGNWPFINPISTDAIVWHHRAYITPERRIKKYEQYLSKKDHLNPQELAHAMSIVE